jgi:hypothetical protein
MRHDDYSYILSSIATVEKLLSTAIQQRLGMCPATEVDFRGWNETLTSQLIEADGEMVKLKRFFEAAEAMTRVEECGKIDELARLLDWPKEDS